jgi:uncharacterized protein YecE (DUF72 family)
MFCVHNTLSYYMDFGRTTALAHVDFTLPEDAEATHRVLAEHPDRGDMKLYIGCPVWAVKEWVGTYYPPGSKEKDFLYHYTRQFNTIELNATHYHLPSKDQVDKWKETAAPGFKFCPKFPQQISHRPILLFSDEWAGIFLENLACMQTHLGIAFLQLPPAFTPAQLPSLARFLEAIPFPFPMAVEFRHEAFFSDALLGEEAFALLEEYGTHAVITDVAGRRDVVHMRLTSRTVLIRWVGENLHPTDFERIKHWSQRLSSWQDKGIREVYFFVHQKDNLHAARMASFAIETFNEALGLRHRIPQLFQLPEQGRLF